MMSNTRFAKFLVAVNGAVPLALLGWDAYHHQLGANPIKFAILTTGLMALIFLSLTLLVTPVRKLTGINALISTRRMLGLYAFFYASIHFLIFFIYDRQLSVSGTLTEVFNRPYLVIGAFGLLLMVPLAVTSTNRMIQRLGAKRWQALHRLVYLAAIAGALHYYMQAKADKRQPLAFAIVIGILLLWRMVMHYRRLQTESRQFRAGALAAPLANRAAASTRPKFWTGQLRVARIFDETPSVRTFRLTEVDGGHLPFDFQPGQYLNLSLMVGGKKVNRSYTIASSPTSASYCELTIKREDNGLSSRYMHDQVREGDLLNISAPAGRFTFSGAGVQGIVLIGGGVGITPLMSVLRYLTDNCWPGQIHLIYCAKTDGDVIFLHELEYLRRRFPNLSVTLTLSRVEGTVWAGRRGRVTADLLKQTIPDLPSRLFHICGPSEMMSAVTRLLRDLGVAESSIKTEAFEYNRPASGGVASDAQTGVDADGAELFADATTDALADASLSTGAETNGASHRVTFAASNKLIEVSPPATLLEAAESAGINLEFECRSGICGTCKTRLLSGRVHMETQDALDASDRARNIILACQARPLEDVSIQA